ncbi:MAG: hypothetical protein JXQ23_12110, partial [Clostridia bacterium]|nr:hypothetical protein [Clostridia bacterium]
FNIYLMNGTTAVTTSTLAFTLENVAESAITSISMTVDNNGRLLTNSNFNNLGQYTLDSSCWDEAVLFTGYKADGTSVSLLYNEQGMPLMLDTVTFSEPDRINTGFDRDKDYPNTMTVYALVGSESDYDGTVEIRAWKDGNMVASSTLTLTKELPYVAEMYFKDTEVTMQDLNISTSLVIKDQYGKNCSIPVIFGSHISSETRVEGDKRISVATYQNGYTVLTSPTEMDDDSVSTVTIILKDGTFATTIKVIGIIAD